MNEEYKPSKSEKSGSKFIVVGALGLMTILGTWGGTKGGFTPFYTVKTGDSYGINFSVFTDYMPGANHQGLDVSIIKREFKGGRLNGVGLSLFSVIDSKSKLDEDGYEIKNYVGSEINGLEASVLNIDVDGLKKVNGLQVGLVNQARAGNVFQVGVYNSTSSGEFPSYGEDNREVRRGALLNYSSE